MAKDSFVHLHLHTEYSLLDGSVRIAELMKKAARLEMPAVAMTDHGNLYGAVDFYTEAKEAGILPIFGCEVYVAPGSMHEKKSASAKDAAFHLTLLAESDIGYRNLVKLVTAGHLEGFYYKPRVDHDLLATHSEGLIALSGCMKGEVSQHLLAGRRDEAKNTVATYRDIFGADNYFIELHNHGIESQIQLLPELLRLSKEFNLAPVAANDVHFLERSHHEAHDIMICIGTGSLVADEKRLHYVPELYFKSYEEMAALFPDNPEALANTVRIAERITMRMDFGTSKYPSFDPPEGKTQEGYLRELCFEGLRSRYGERAESDPELLQRLEYEIGVIEKTGFVSYFLIVWDFIRYARSKGIPVGPGRGSAAGSLIAYVLGITDIDPLRYGLIFERFLNPERVSPPDIDVDFCMDRRGEVIEYVRKKYGERAVAQIVTFGTLGAKSVVRDVARVLSWSYGDADRLAKLIPNELNITLKVAAEKNPELKSAIENDQSTKQLWDYALLLEGISRNTGIHAAGVVIGDRPLDEFIPLCRGKENEVVSQFAMDPLSKLGMLKMDFLGLKTLTVIEEALRLIRRKHPDFDLNTIPLDDPASFDILNRGETVGIFQLEGGGITSCCKRFGITRLEDIIAINALYRPGPMQFIDDYIARKKGQKKVVYAHPLLEDICSETYGIMVYQEQVQRVANVLAGFSLSQADLLRRAMGKKDKDKMAEERAKFVAGCGETHGIDAKQADAIFEYMAKFAEYGFNKSHSAAYGLIAYQTAYLKAHHPVEFMAGLMGADADKTEKISGLIAECRRLGIDVFPPDINKGDLKFTPVDDPGSKAILFGLSAIKNVGSGAMESAIAERQKNGPFVSLEEFCARLDSRTVNRKIVESLIKSGAFDSFGIFRSQLFADIDGAMASAAATHRDKASGQVSMFEEMDLAPSQTNGNSRNTVEPWPQEEMLSYEKELLGYYITGHPLDDFAGTLESTKYTQISELDQIEGSATVQLGGIILSVEKKFAKKDGKPFGVVVLEDFSGSAEITFWNEAFSQGGDLIQTGKTVSLSARASKRDENLRISANSISALTPRPSKKPVRIRLNRKQVREEDLKKIGELARKYSGKRPLEIEFAHIDKAGPVIRAGKDFSIGDARAFRSEVAGNFTDLFLPQ